MTDLAADSADTATGYVAYEYLSVPVPRQHLSVYRDSYAHFGWQARATDDPTGPIVTLVLRRDRALANRPVIDELQRRCERALKAVVELERSAPSRGAAAGIVVGVIGAALLAGAVFALQAGLILLTVLLGTAGLIAWAVTRPIVGLARRRRSRATASLIAKQHDAADEARRQAHTVLN